MNSHEMLSVWKPPVYSVLSTSGLNSSQEEVLITCSNWLEHWSGHTHTDVMGSSLHLNRGKDDMCERVGINKSNTVFVCPFLCLFFLGVVPARLLRWRGHFCGLWTREISLPGRPDAGRKRWDFIGNNEELCPWWHHTHIWNLICCCAVKGKRDILLEILWL